MSGKGGSVYLLTNKNNTVIYTGVTSDLISRVHEHKTKKYPNSFTARYNLNRLVYYEHFHNIEEAMERERVIKAGSRLKKENLIQEMNPEWLDLYEALDF